MNYKTNNVCASNINYDLKDGKIYNLTFTGGCSGNLKAISKLVEGMDINQVIKLLEGIDCHGRGTSCADQLTKALKEEK